MLEGANFFTGDGGSDLNGLVTPTHDVVLVHIG
jgi:hypothetical protein